MSQILDQIKYNMQGQLGKAYKDLKTKMGSDDWSEFESWFWKIRPYLNVDLSQYRQTQQAETSGPAMPAREITPVNETV